MVCDTCGAENPGDANYCSVCGAHLARPDDDEVTTVLHAVDDLDTVPHAVEASEGAAAEVPAESAILVVSRGPNAGSKFVVTDRATIGRHPDSDFFLDDVTVSRRHAEVRREGGEFTLKDNGSLNGTYVNGERVEKCGLQHGDEIRIGKYVIVFLRG